MTTMSSASKLSDRAQQILRALIEQYIRDGEPVGSRTLSKSTELQLSPATIRNVMSDLEELGFLRSPHTSAGRIPTDLGYRFFVDSLVQVQRPETLDLSQLEGVIKLSSAASPQNMVEQVSSFLSGVTHMAGIVTLPKRETTRLRHVEFLPLANRRVLCILVINDDEVQNRILHVERDYSSSELEQITNFLNAQFAGKELSRVRSSLKMELDNARALMNEMMQSAIEMAGKAIDEDAEKREEFVVAGQTNLMNFNELSSVGKLKELFEEFNRKREIYHLLERCADAQGIQIYIGRESGYRVFDECSLVTAPYTTRQGDVAGVIGVIGPTRMAYEKIIPIVDVTSKLLSAALNPKS